MLSNSSFVNQSNHYDLRNRVAIVTGSDSGIGRSVAILLAQSGCNIIICYRQNEQGAIETSQFIKDLGRKSLIVQVDISNLQQVELLFEKTFKYFNNQLDILINNAGITGDFNNVIDKEFHDWEEVIRINLHGAFYTSKLAAKHFVQNKTNQLETNSNSGVIINITSIRQQLVCEGSAGYSASKKALESLTQTMALELGPYGIRVCAVCPGLIDTPMTSFTTQNDHKRINIEKQIPLRRIGHVNEIGHMICFLCSNDASYCTGQTYIVDGGWLLTNPSLVFN